jgi:hypothetical protein
MKTKTFRIYSVAIGRPGVSYYKPRQEFGTIEATGKMDALDKIAEKIGERHIKGLHSIAVLGVGSLTVEEA